MSKNSWAIVVFSDAGSVFAIFGGSNSVDLIFDFNLFTLENMNYKLDICGESHNSDTEKVH